MDLDSSMRVKRISDAMRAARGTMRDLIEMAGCHAETRRDAWMFMNGTHHHDASHADIDVIDDSLVMGRLRVPSDAEVTRGPGDASFIVDGVTWTIDTADLEGNALYGMEELTAACARWALEGRSIIVDHGVGSEILDAAIPICGASPKSNFPSILVPALSIDVPWFMIGTNGVMFETPDRAVVMPHGGRAITIRAVMTNSVPVSPDSQMPILTGHPHRPH